MIIKIFEEQVEKFPGRNAVITDKIWLTYRELNRYSNRLAHTVTGIDQESGKKAVNGQNTALLFEHSADMIIGMLGALKAGKVYVPLDVTYPENRLTYMLENSKISLLLTNNGNISLAKKLVEKAKTDLKILNIESIDIDSKFPGFPDENPKREPCGDKLAYILYTSGSTGKPKGVMQDHKSVCYFIENITRECSISSSDRITLLSSFSHDAAVVDIFGALLNGAALYLFNVLDRTNAVMLSRWLNEEKITIWHSVPTLFRYFINTLTSDDIGRFVNLRTILLGGEAVRKHDLQEFQRFFPQSVLVNIYGQTESTISSLWQFKPGDKCEQVLIGKSLERTTIFLINEKGEIIEDIGVGEIIVACEYIARGYWQDKNNTDQVFTYDPELGRLYWTGDLGRLLADGSIEFLGRKDGQVKIRGFRVEMGEIETRLLNHPAVKEAVVTAKEDEEHMVHLCAYIVPADSSRGTSETANSNFTVSAMREYLSRELPEYMIPSYLVQMEKLPLTPNGKIDRKRLPEPEHLRPQLGVTYVAPKTSKEKEVSDIWKEILKLDQVGINDNFFDLGGTSFDVLKIMKKVHEVFHLDIPVVTIFRYPTIGLFAEYLEEEEGRGQGGVGGTRAAVPGKSKAGRRKPRPASAVLYTPIAVIGMAGRFPGARNIEEFWDNLKKGTETISFFSTVELEEQGVDGGLLSNSNYVRAFGVLEGVDYFDAAFFQYSPAEAEVMDPQLRLLHECSWEALENAGYNPDSYNGNIGIYAGNAINQHWVTLTYFNQRNTLDTMFLNSNYSTKVSYKLNLQGPSVIVQTACSTSLVVIHMACQGLARGECDIALAGGVSIMIPDRVGYLYQEGMVLSPDGHCRSFAAQAGGSVFGNGVGIVVLKRLEDAQADSDFIDAVIKGSAINNDGNRKVGITAPSVQGQAEVITMAQEAAGLDPAAVSYIETHGTGTIMGDPVEFEALKLAFNTDRKKYCAIGSVKTNVGHLNTAAGVTGLIKTILALKYKQIPPSLFFDAPNPAIDFDNSPFYVNTRLIPWESNVILRRAGVNAFGIGGTNAHVVLEEWPSNPMPETGCREQGVGCVEFKNATPLNSREYRLILLSAKTERALEKMAQNLVEYFKDSLFNHGNHKNPVNPGLTLADAAYTLQVGRKDFKYRKMLVCTGANELQGLAAAPVFTVVEGNRPVVFMLAGQGTQYVNMGLDLYRREKVFKEEMDRCFEILKPLMGFDIKDILYPRSDHSDLSIHQPEIVQPVLFIFEYALARLLMSWGIEPTAMIGYSMGEYIAACLAGVFTLEDALQLVVGRGQLMRKIPPGVMLSVPLPEEEVEPLLSKDLYTAICNGPSTIVAGSPEAAAAFEKEMKQRRLLCGRVNMTRALHTPQMNPIRQEFEQMVANAARKPPQIPYKSNVTGNWITVEEAMDPRYWGKHLCSTARFAEGFRELYQEDSSIFIEIGPGRVLGNLLRQHSENNSRHMIINLIRHQEEKFSDDYYLLKRIGQLWLYGLSLDWGCFYKGEKRQRVHLPTYPFAGERYWIDHRQLKAVIAGKGAAVPAQPWGLKETLIESSVLTQRSRPELSTAYAAPITPTQKTLVAIWEDLLGMPQVGIDDDFIELGGDSLKAINFIGRIHQELQVEVPLDRFFVRPTLRQLVQYIEEKNQKKQFESIKVLEKKEYYKLSSSQQRLYVLHQLEAGTLGHNIPVFFRLEGELDRSRLERALRDLIYRHESFRTTFEMVGVEPVQRIHDKVEFEIEYDEVEAKVKVEEERASRLEGTKGLAPLSFIRPFDLSKAPLLRVGLIRESENLHILMMDIHHIVFDGTSMAICFRDFAALYRGVELSGLRVQYKDYAAWQAAGSAAERMQRQREYWGQVFKGNVPVLDLPLDYPRPAVQSHEGTSLRFEIEPLETTAIRTLARQNQVTLFMVLLGIYGILLSRLSGQQDIAIGTPVAGRKNRGTRHVIGVFLNTLALRIAPNGQKNFKTYLQEIKNISLEAFENQEYPFEQLVEQVEISRDLSRNPLFDVMFILQNQFAGEEIGEEESAGLRVSLYPPDKQSSLFDINFVAYDRNLRLEFVVEYCTRVLKKETLQRWTTYFKRIAAAVAQEGEITLADIDILSPAERKELLEDFNRTDMEYSHDKTVHRLFAEQVERTPDQVALLGLSNLSNLSDSSDLSYLAYISITYRELNERSGHLAKGLKGQGVIAGTIVGLMMNRTVEMMVGLLGILKAGGAYLPIDPGYPGERIDYMLKDSGAKILVSDRKGVGTGQCPVPTYSPATAVSSSTLTLTSTYQVGGANLAYVIYTSGSTGKPKGVAIRHRSVINFIEGMAEIIDFSTTKTILAVTTICFDIFVLETLLPLTRGMRVVIAGELEQSDRGLLAGVIRRQGVQMAQLTPSRLKMLLGRPEDPAGESLTAVKVLIVGGEAFPAHLLKSLQERYPGKIYNVYGPTETTVWSSVKDLTGEEEITIGRPIANTRVYILDKQERLQPIGIPGELFIGGDGVAAGYLNNPVLTAEKFCLRRPGGSFRENRPLDPRKSFLLNLPEGHFYLRAKSQELRAILYKTGDQARWLSNGEIEFLGRMDFQVKVRGFRIELEEIENRLMKHPGVQEAVAIVKKEKTGDNTLCAYMVRGENSGAETGSVGIREHLAAVLPDYMIPSFFVFLEQMPLTPNGKIDRKALPDPRIGMGKEEGYVAPRDRQEAKLVEMWSEILGIEKSVIGIETSFFALGGHSLKATQLLAKVHQEFNSQVSLGEFFKNPTVKGFSQVIRAAAPERYTLIPKTEKKEYYHLSSSQKRLYILQQVEGETIGHNLPSVIKLEGKLEKERFESTVRQLVQRHEAFRTSFTMIKGEPVQVIQEGVEFAIEYYGEEDKPDPKSQELRAKSYINHFIRPFNLSRAPLLRIGLIKLGEEEHILLKDVHHIIYDGTSLTVFYREFIDGYRGREFPPLVLSYKDFAEWQTSIGEKEKLKNQEKYWAKEFEGEIPVLNMPTDFPRPAVQSFEGNTLRFEISREMTRELKIFAVHQGTTLFILLLSLYTLMLSKLSGQEDIVVGTPVAGRKHPELQPIIGVFLNTLAVRNHPNPGKTFQRFLEEVKTKTLNAFDNQDYPFDNLVEKVAVNRDLSRNPLFDAMLILHTQFNPESLPTDEQPGQPGLELKRWGYRRQISQFDLTLVGFEENDGLAFNVEYCTGLFKEETITRYIDYFKNIVTRVLENPGRVLVQIDIRSDEEKRRVLEEFNETTVDYPREKTIHRLFEEQVERTPDHIAVIGPHQSNQASDLHGTSLSAPISITYRELNLKSRQLAQLLLEKGVKTETIVGIMVSRSEEMMIGLLGILKAGGAYLPLDPATPGARLDYMLADSGAKILLSDRNDLGAGQCPVPILDLIHVVHNESSIQRVRTGNYSEDGTGTGQSPLAQNSSNPGKVHSISSSTSTSACQVGGANLAYVIYTSGSTGKPKGVIITHDSVGNFIKGITDIIPFTERDTILSLTTLSFDIFGLETLLPLTRGTRVIIGGTVEQISVEAAAAVLVRGKVTLFQVTPSRLQGFLAHPEAREGLKWLTYLLVGGEAFPEPLLQKARELTKRKIINLYGPTETTIWSAVKDLTGEVPLTIGKPIANTWIYILDKNDGMTPIGTVGELCIGGDGLARGYLNKPELTAEKFDQDYQKFFRGSRGAILQKSPPGRRRLYKTGDLARWLSNGEIEFLGRLDYQVKIRGFRIELAEIENHLQSHEAIKDAVVIVEEDEQKNKYLCAYIVKNETTNEAPDITKLRAYLSGRLPDYMIPFTFIQIEKIPLNQNGKVDRKALQANKGVRLVSGMTYVAPAAGIQSTIADTWKEVLGLDIVGINDNFFELGGNSMKVIQLNARINEVLNRNIPVAIMFRYLTIRTFTDYLKEETNTQLLQEKRSEEREALKAAARTYKNTINRYKRGVKHV